MAENQEPVIPMSQLQELMRTIIQENNKMNPLDQKKFDQDMQREKRRQQFSLELGKIEEQKRINMQNNCSHCRDPRTGQPAPRGTGEWRTSGQLHSNGTATMICQLCSLDWHWAPTPQERDYIENAGMLGMAPPAKDRLIVA